MAQGAKDATMKSESAEAKATDAMKTTAATKAIKAMKPKPWPRRRWGTRKALKAMKRVKPMKPMKAAKKSTRAEDEAEDRSIFHLLALEGTIFGCGF